MSAPVPAAPSAPPVTSDPTPLAHSNEVALVGRVGAAPETRTLPSGDELVSLRLVVDRPPRRGSTRREVDVIDVACWSSRTRRTATTLRADDVVRVQGALRRRFFATGSGRASRYEVEAVQVARLTRPAG